MTATTTTLILGDAVAAQFLRDGDAVVVDGVVYTVGNGRVYGRDGRLHLSVYNHLGGIEGLAFDPAEMVPLATVLP